MTITNSVSPATGVVKAVFRLATDAPGAGQNQIDPLPNLTLRLLPTTRNSLVPGTLFLSLARMRNRALSRAILETEQMPWPRALAESWSARIFCRFWRRILN